MAASRRVGDENLSYEEAKDREVNILHRLGYLDKQRRLYSHLYRRQGLIAERVAHHLGLKSASICRVEKPKFWLKGSFNVCVPVSIDDSTRVLMRFPLGYRVGDEFQPGNGDEKVRCEAGSYAWIRQECPDIPIPALYGFSLSSGQCFTTVAYLSPFRRLLERLRRLLLSILGRPLLSSLVPHECSLSTELGPYLLLEYVEAGEMLSATLKDHYYEDEKRRTNIFRGIARVILTLSRTPLPVIGSFIVDDDGLLRLANRPLTMQIHELENEGIPVNIPRDQTYPTVDSYVNALLSNHDARLRHEPNAVNDEPDCMRQLSALVIARSVASQFFDSKFNTGPFLLSLTDLHPSNIIVDGAWNILYILDLEWASSLPLQFTGPPSWLTMQAHDMIDPETYNIYREEFMDIFQGEEMKMYPDRKPDHTTIMQEGWRRGTFWYTLALASITCLNTLFYKRIQPIFSTSHLEEENFYLITYRYWSSNVEAFIETKLREKENYDKDLKAAYESTP